MCGKFETGKRGKRKANEAISISEMIIVWTKMGCCCYCQGIEEKEIDSRAIYEIKLTELEKGQYLRDEGKDDS